jgi:lysophospholipid acyltransferase (LPLAT)-like uncharacterized protein
MRNDDALPYGRATAPPRGGQPSSTNIERVYQFADLSGYSFKDRWLIRAADLAFYLTIKLIGGTIRFEVEGWENWEAASSNGRVPIYSFWHSRIFIGTYFFRRRGIVIMTSRSFDGEYIARFIQRFGYGAVRGSSTRGATGALIEMVRLLRAGHPTGLTLDGPKGPPHVAKMGAVLLAKKTGHPILPFTFASRKFWEIGSTWDRTQIPRPFTRARVFIAPPIFVGSDVSDDALESTRQELQSVMDRLEQEAQQWRASL